MEESPYDIIENKNHFFYLLFERRFIESKGISLENLPFQHRETRVESSRQQEVLAASTSSMKLNMMFVTQVEVSIP